MQWNLVLDLLIKGEDLKTIISQLEEVIEKLKKGEIRYDNFIKNDENFEIEYEVRKKQGE